MRHIGIQHYPKKLVAYLGDSLDCSACGKRASKMQDLKTHVIFVHNPLQDVLDELFQEGGSFNKEAEEVPSGEVEKKREVRKEKSTPARVECSFCERSFQAKNPHSIHVALKHLRQQIIDTYVAKDERRCLICDKTFNRDVEAMIHLATKHNVVAKALGQEDEVGADNGSKSQPEEEQESSLEETVAC